jgi:nanoRNase/pAp phosphatase (c-di-AMP/oligoRNAs hydrolase)
MGEIVGEKKSHYTMAHVFFCAGFIYKSSSSCACASWLAANVSSAVRERSRKRQKAAFPCKNYSCATRRRSRGERVLATEAKLHTGGGGNNAAAFSYKHTLALSLLGLGASAHTCVFSRERKRLRPHK